MLWLYAEDIAFYSNNEIAQIKKEYGVEEIYTLPNPNELRGIISKTATGSGKAAIMAPCRPPEELAIFFVFKKIQNKFGILTSQEKHNGVTEDEALKKRLGISVVKSKTTIEDVSGVRILKKWLTDYMAAEQKGYRAKGVCFVGIPGSGKSFFVKAFAGTTGRLLVALNLSEIMEKESPIDTINGIFEYLESIKDGKFIIWIDEIEKMIGNGTPEEKRILGRMLTVQNDLHTHTSEYHFDAIFMATANDISGLLDNNPEMLRRGRWDELFFLNLPAINEALDFFELYMKKLNVSLDGVMYKNKLLSLKEMAIEVEQKYKEHNTQPSKFPYTPAEIEQFVKKLNFANLAHGCIREEDINDAIEMIIPILSTAKNSISRMLAQKNLFYEV